LLLAACGSSDPTAKKPENATASCNDDDVGQDCDDCDEGQTGTTVCNDDGELACQCSDPEPETAKKDAGKSKDAGSPAKKDGATPAVQDASPGAPREDASTPDDKTPSTSGDGPKIPAITGDCPDFKSGTMTIGGLANITVEVGSQKSGGPLLFYWHGTGSFAGEYKGLLPAAVQKDILSSGGIIISPQDTTNKGADCSGTQIFKQGDFEVMDLIAACAVKNNGIDPRKIYTTGCSAGGLQAGCMGMMRSSYIAAVAPNSGGEVFNQKQQDEHTPALMTMHGGASDMVFVQFSQTSKTADTQYKQSGGFVMNCNHGGGHCGAPAELQSAAWEFMKAHPFGVAPEPYSTVPTNFPSYCTIY
jgi:predicted esterase